jgi:D-citramalate synthase
MPKDAPFNNLCLKIDGEVMKSTQGDGQFDAFMNALAKYIKKQKLNYKSD